MTGFASRRLILASLAGLGVVGLVVGVLVVGSPLSSSPPTDDAWQPPRSVVSGPAVRGPWRMNESNWRFVDDPTVALADDGTARVIWTDHTRQNLFFQAYGPDGTPQLETPTNVSQYPGVFSWLPRMVVPENAPETIYVLWQEVIFSGGTHGGETLFVCSQDGGRTFSEPINLSQSEAGDGKGRLSKRLWHNGSLDLAVDPDGHVYAAWTEYEGRLWLRRSVDGGQSFSEPVHVAGGSADPARAPSLAIGPAGTVHLAWAVGEDPAADIQYTRSEDAWNAFAEPESIAASEGHSDAPKLAIDDGGTVHLAYGESPSGPLREYHIQYTQGDGGPPFSSPTTLARSDPGPYESAHFPYLRLQNDTTVHLAWELFPEAGGRSHAIAYARSTDGGNTFTEPAIIPGTDSTTGFNGSQQGLLMEKLAVNDAGDLVVVNSTFQEGEASHIWLHRRPDTPE